MRGGNFDWDNWAGLPPAEQAKQQASKAALLESPESPIRQLLHGLQKLMHRPGKAGDAAGKDSVRCASVMVVLMHRALSPGLSSFYLRSCSLR